MSECFLLDLFEGAAHLRFDLDWLSKVWNMFIISGFQSKWVKPSPSYRYLSALSQYSSDEAASSSAAVKTRLTSCWQRAESGAEAKKTVEMDLSMPLVISFNIIKSFYSFRSSRGLWPGMTNAVEKASLCQESCCCPVCCCQTRSLNSF